MNGLWDLIVWLATVYGYGVTLLIVVGLAAHAAARDARRREATLSDE